MTTIIFYPQLFVFGTDCFDFCHFVSTGLRIHLNQLQAQARFRLRIGPCATFIADSCKEIAYKLRGRVGRRRHHRNTPGELKHAWAAKQLTTATASPPEVPQPVPWSDSPRAPSDRGKFIKQRVREIKEYHAKEWAVTWETYRRAVSGPAPAQAGPIGKERLKIHAQLRKVESSLTTQIRSEKIGFADFLHRRKVSGVDSPACRCGWNRQTAKHVIMFCPMMNDRREILHDVGHSDYNQMMNSGKSLKIIVKWLISHDLLTQYALVSELIYTG
jgi:hypothetical protein